jgi:hypothetical protein
MFAIKSFMAPGFTLNRPLNRLRKRILRISFEEVTFNRRGFKDDCVQETRERLEHIGQTFLLGHHAALNDEGPEALASYLERIDREFCGFAYEGAAMGLTLLDQLSRRNRARLLTFLSGLGSKHAYMIHVGVGWAIARLPWLRRNLNHAMAHLDPLLRWLATDGIGFSDFYFNSTSFLRSPQRLNRLQGYARHAYAQGVGRSLWFVAGADTNQITVAISALPSSLRGDLWSGAGLACAMAGGANRQAVERLRAAAGVYKAALAQGAAFAAKTRQRADNPAEHTEMACQVICRLSADRAAQLTDAMLQNLPEDGEMPAYEIWRQRIQSQITRS